MKKLAAFNIECSRATALNFRIDGLTIWEKRVAGWFILTFRHRPERVERVVRPDGRVVEVRHPAGVEFVSIKQASRKEKHVARELLARAPF